MNFCFKVIAVCGEIITSCEAALSSFLCFCPSVYVWEDPVRDASAVGVPCKSILGPALSLVPVLSVNQQDGKINYVEVRQEM